MYLHHYYAEPAQLSDIPATSPIAAFHAYWRHVAPPGRLPGRQHIDPVEIPRVIPWLLLADVLREGETVDFHYRLVGTMNAALLGRDVTRQRLSESFHPEATGVIMRHYRMAVDAAEPMVWSTEVPSWERRSTRCFRALFPLARDGVTVDLLAGLLVPKTQRM